MRPPELFIKDILESIELIKEFTEGMSLKDFKGDIKTSDAVIKRFEIIGEAAKNIPRDIKKRYPAIPWREMADMRDKLVHFYFGVRYELIWTAIETRLPEIKEKIKKLFEEVDFNNYGVNK